MPAAGAHAALTLRLALLVTLMPNADYAEALRRCSGTWRLCRGCGPNSCRPHRRLHVGSGGSGSRMPPAAVTSRAAAITAGIPTTVNHAELPDIRLEPPWNMAFTGW